MTSYFRVVGFQGMKKIIDEVHREMPHMERSDIRRIVLRYCREITRRCGYKNVVTIKGFGAFSPDRHQRARRKREVISQNKRRKAKLKKKKILDNKVAYARDEVARGIRNEYITTTFAKLLQKKIN